MDNHMVFDDRAKTRIGIICFIPLIAFAICFVYYLTLLGPLSGRFVSGAVVGITREHYDTLLIMLAASAIITAPIFIYCLVLLARFKHMNAASKLIWIVFLSVMAPIASVFFWIFHVKGMPKYVPIHPDIA